MADTTGARAPDVDVDPPPIDWDAIESDHDDDEARALIAQVKADEEYEQSLEVGEIAQTPEEQAEAAERERKRKEEEEMKRKEEEVKRKESDQKKVEENMNKKEEDEKMSEGRGRGPRRWGNQDGGPNDWGGGGYRGQKKKKQGKDKTRFTCDICNIEIIGEKSRDSHLRGKNHRNKARQAALRATNEELNRHGAKIAEQQARRKHTPEADPESRFDHPGRPNGHNRDFAREPARDDDRRDTRYRENDRDPRRRGVDARDLRRKEDEPRASRSAYYRRSTDPRPRYFDAAVTPDPRPTPPRVSNGMLPDLEADDSTPEPGHMRSPSGDDGSGRGGEHGSATGGASNASGYPSKYVVSTPRPAPDTGRLRSQRPVTPDTSHGVGEKSTERDARPSVPSAVASGKSSFLPTGPRKSVTKSSASEPSKEKGPSAEDSVTALKEGKRPSTDLRPGSSNTGTRSIADAKASGSTSAADIVVTCDKTGSSKELDNPTEGAGRSSVQGKKAEVAANAGTSGSSKEASNPVGDAGRSSVQGKKAGVAANVGSSGVGTTMPLDARADKGGDGKTTATNGQDDALLGGKAPDDDRREESHEEKKSVPGDRANRSGEKTSQESDSRRGDRREDRRPISEGKVDSSRDDQRMTGDDGLGSSPQQRRSPPYDRASFRDDRSSPLQYGAAQLLEDRARRADLFDRDGSREDRRSPPYDRAGSREGRRSPPYDQAGSREDRRAPPYKRSTQREDRKSPPSDHGGSREQRGLSSSDRGDAREGRRSPPYDGTDSRDGRRPPPDDRASGSGDRKRSKFDSRESYGDARRSSVDSRTYDPRDGRRPRRDDRDTAGEATDYRASGADWDKRPAAEPGKTSREKYGADKDRKARDSSPASYQREAPPPPPPLKLRSQAVPARPEDDTYGRDAKRRRFTSVLDPGRTDSPRFKSAPAPYEDRPRSALPGDSQPRYEVVNDGSQRRKLLESVGSESRRRENYRDRFDEELRYKDGSREEERRQSSAGERSAPRDSERHGNGDLQRRHSVGPSQPDRGNGEAQRSLAATPRMEVAGTADGFNPEDYPPVPEEYLKETMSVAEWRELRHFVLNEGSEVDKLAYKMMQEIILSPVLGINISSLAPFSRAMMASVKKHYFTPRGVFAKLADFPEGIRRLDPKYNSGAKEDEDWSRHQTPEYLALCQVRDNIEFTFNTNEHPGPKKDNKTTLGGRAEFPTRGSFGVRNQRKGPGIVNDGERPPRYEDSVAEDPLFKQLMNYLSAREFEGRPGHM